MTERTEQREVADTRLERSASISDDGLYRYDLGRRWDDGPLALWIMLNPSTADGNTDDPTLRRVMTFSRAVNCGGCAIVNLYAYRATNPKELSAVDDPVGPDNERYLTSWLARPADEVKYAVAAWGDKLPRHRPHPPVILIAERCMRTLHCLGRTKSGRPRHPLYVPERTTLSYFTRPAALQ